jgi:hypothetical protein
MPIMIFSRVYFFLVHPLHPNGQVGLEKIESMALLFTTISMEKNAICKN